MINKTTPSAPKFVTNISAVVAGLLEDLRLSREANPWVKQNKITRAELIDFYTVKLKGARQAGKTDYLIQRVAAGNAVMLVRDLRRVDQVISDAKDRHDVDISGKVVTDYTILLISRKVMRCEEFSDYEEAAIRAFKDVNYVLVDDASFLSGQEMDAIYAMSIHCAEDVEFILLG